MNNLYSRGIWAFWRCETDHFATRNGPNETMKWTELERKMASLRKRLRMSELQESRGET